MIAELTVVPVGASTHISKPVARVIQEIRHSGLEHQITAMGTLVEGEPEAVWKLIRKCHDVAAGANDRVILELRVDTGRTERGGLRKSVEDVEALLSEPA